MSRARLVLYGFTTWIIPFLVSVLFVRPGGQFWGGVGLFKSVMVVVGTAVGAVLLTRVFRQPSAHVPNGLAVGSVWLAINIALDFAILIPFTRMPLAEYWSEIALRYLTIPIMAVAIDRATSSARASGAPHTAQT